VFKVKYVGRQIPCDYTEPVLSRFVYVYIYIYIYIYTHTHTHKQTRARRWADKFCLHCNIFIFIRHIWIKPVLCSRMVSLSLSFYIYIYIYIYIYKGEVPMYAMEVYRVEHHSFLTSKLDGSSQIHNSFVLIRGKTSLQLLNGRLGGPRAGLDGVEKR